jgi:cell division protein FtsB
MADRARVSPVRFSLVAATAALLIGATAYLGTASVLWYLRVGDLRVTTADLAETLSTQKSANRAQADHIVALSDELEITQSAIIDEAHRKALMQDGQIGYRDVSEALKVCANERDSVLPYVLNRSRYYVWTIHAYDDDVTAICDSVVSALHEQIAGEST